MKPTVTELIEALGDYRTRSQARRELGKLGEAAAPELIKLLGDSEGHTNARWSAVTLLAQCRCPEAATVLLQVMREDENLRGEACRALQKISGLEIGEDLEAWEQALNAQTEDAPAAAAEAIAGERVVTNPLLDLVQKSMAGLTGDVSWEEGGYVLVRVPLHEGRKQQMIIMPEESETEQGPCVCIYTECGPEPPHVEQVVYRRNVTLPYGKFTIEKDEAGHGKVVMRHLVAASQLNAEKLNDIIMVMSREADNLEFEITHSDII